jgi:hypothetical protein
MPYSNRQFRENYLKVFREIFFVTNKHFFIGKFRNSFISVRKHNFDEIEYFNNFQMYNINFLVIITKLLFAAARIIY